MQWFLGISCQHFPSYWCQNSFRTVTVSGQSPFSRKAELFVFKYFCRFLMENSNHESSLQNFASKLLYQNIFSLLSIPFNIAHWAAGGSRRERSTLYSTAHVQNIASFNYVMNHIISSLIIGSREIHQYFDQDQERYLDTNSRDQVESTDFRRLSILLELSLTWFKRDFAYYFVQERTRSRGIFQDVYSRD